MQKKLFTGAVVVMGCGILASCGGGHDKIRDFVPGTYVRSISNEFTTGDDSLVISELDPSGGTYLVMHRSGFRQVVDGRVLPRQVHSEQWTGIYDPGHHQMQIQNQEKTFTFLPEKGELLTAGGTEYKKVQK